MRSDKASVTVLTHAFAFSFLSNLFLIFFIGVLLLVPLPPPGNDVSEIPGNSPRFQCFFLTTDEEDDDLEGGDEIAKRVTLKIESWVLGFGEFLHLLSGEIGEGMMEEENEQRRGDGELVCFWSASSVLCATMTTEGDVVVLYGYVGAAVGSGKERTERNVGI